MSWGEFITWTIQGFIWGILGVIILMGIVTAVRKD